MQNLETEFLSQLKKENYLLVSRKQNSTINPFDLGKSFLWKNKNSGYFYGLKIETQRLNRNAHNTCKRIIKTRILHQ